MTSSHILVGAIEAPANPVVRRVTPSDLFDALARGVDDFLAMPSHAIFLCVIYPLIGILLIGLALGYSLSLLADHYRWLRLNEDVYALSYVPFNPHWQDGIWIAAAAIAVSLIATLYPAKAATSIAPVEALRYE